MIGEGCDQVSPCQPITSPVAPPPNVLFHSGYHIKEFILLKETIYVQKLVRVSAETQIVSKFAMIFMHWIHGSGGHLENAVYIPRSCFTATFVISIHKYANSPSSLFRRRVAQHVDAAKTPPKIANDLADTAPALFAVPKRPFMKLAPAGALYTASLGTATAEHRGLRTPSVSSCFRCKSDK